MPTKKTPPKGSSQAKKLKQGPTQSNQSQPSETLALSPLHQKLEKLQADRQWLLKQIGRKRTELDKFIEQMRAIGIEMAQRGTQIFMEMRHVDDEIHTLFKEILAQRKLGKRSKSEVQNIYISLQLQHIITLRPETLSGTPIKVIEPDLEDVNFYPDPEEVPDEIDPTLKMSQPSERDLRQTFLRLASVYHPDRAADGETQQQNTEIMKEINRAYQERDFARLLELEQLQLSEAPLDLATMGDDLEKNYQKLLRENEVLREQYEVIKEQLRDLRNNTYEGMMVKTYRKAEKAGIDFVASLLEEAQEELNDLEKVRDFVKAFRHQKISLKEFIKGPQPESSMEDIIESLLEELDRYR